MTTLPDYEVYALRYAHLPRTRGQNFIEYDPHDGPMPMDYFVWVIRGDDRLWLVDTGFGEAAARARGRELLRCPIESLSVLGIRAEEVENVVLTHLHYDHAGNLPKLPNAHFHLQEREIHYATGRFMRQPFLRHAYDPDDVCEVVRRVYADRVHFHLGDADLAPGLSVIRVGGHTDGLQAVRVHTARGWVVLTSDASHYYANMNERSPFPIVFNLGDMLEGYARLRSLADSDDHLVPGHDPLVRELYPFHGDPHDDCVALHLPPRTGG